MLLLFSKLTAFALQTGHELLVGEGRFLLASRVTCSPVGLGIAGSTSRRSGLEVDARVENALTGTDSESTCPHAGSLATLFASKGSKFAHITLELQREHPAVLLFLSRIRAGSQ